MIKQKILRLTKSKQLISFIVIISILSFGSSIVLAESNRLAGKSQALEVKAASPYKGTLSGEWNGEVMSVSVSGTFTATIAADGTVSGTYAGFETGTITGTINDSGYINAKGSAGISDWSGQLNSSDGRLSGRGTWTGYNVTGSWNSR